MTDPLHIVLPRVMHDLGAVGRDRRNRDQNYTFRAFDDLANALHPVLVKHGVFVSPQVEDAQFDERVTKSGAAMLITRLRVRFVFHGPAGDTIEVVTMGEGSDTSDKATNKAMTAALKYALTQTLMIPTEDTADGDATIPEDTQPRRATRRHGPDPNDPWAAEVIKPGSEGVVTSLLQEVDGAPSVDVVRDIYRRAVDVRTAGDLTYAQAEKVLTACNTRADVLTAAVVDAADHDRDHQETFEELNR